MLSHDDQLLISAYIDGEVTPDEKVRAEQLLVDDATARAFREELLSMSAGLKTLPQHTLPADFAENVLAAAEREMFTGEPWPGDTDTAAPSIVTRIFNSRTIAYAGATIAAALLVAIFLPRDALEGVAQNDDANENVASKSEDREKKESPPATAKEKQGPADNTADEKIAERDGGLTKASPKYEAKDPQVPADDAPFDSLATKESGGKPGDKHAGGGGSGGRGQQPTPPQADAFGGAPFVAPAPKSSATPERRRKNAEPPLMVVSLDIGESAMRDRTLQRVLAANRVHTEDREKVTGYSATNSVKQDASKKTAEKDPTQLLAGGPSTQTVYAEMSRSQLSQVLAQLKTDPKGFSSVELYGGPEELKKSLAAGSAAESQAKQAKLALRQADLKDQLEKTRSIDKVPGGSSPDSSNLPGVNSKDEFDKKKEGKAGDRKSLIERDSKDPESGAGQGGKGAKLQPTGGESGGHGPRWQGRAAVRAAADQRVRVLFVLRTPGEPDSSPAAKEEPTPASER